MQLAQASHRGSITARCFLFVFFFLHLSAHARSSDTPLPYYGADFYRQVENGTEGYELKELLHQVLDRFHQVQPGGFDRITDSCEHDNGDTCYRHAYRSYKQARRFLFGFLHLEKAKSNYVIEDVYCHYVFGPDDFPKGRQPAPGRIPHWQVINAEHSWPQSHFSGEFPKSLQKSDLHAIFPADSSANSQRSNLEFAEVEEVTHETCGTSRKGYSAKGRWQVYFEPPDRQKGDIARALFYFSTRYRMSISDFQEGFLRRWHKLDPVNASEKDRHALVAEFQKIRNPYIDHPWLVELISDF